MDAVGDVANFIFGVGHRPTRSWDCRRVKFVKRQRSGHGTELLTEAQGEAVEYIAITPAVHNSAKIKKANPIIENTSALPLVQK